MSIYGCVCVSLWAAFASLGLFDLLIYDADWMNTM